jgi:DNA-binding CsgD family transcriptional regulator
VRAELAEAQGAPSLALRDAAVAAWRGHEEPYALAVALERAAAARAAAGERAGAREAAEEAQRLARDLGAAPLLTAVALVARSIGLVLAPAGPAPAPQVPAARRPDLGLTPRELEVLRLVAQGRSNRQVGEELVISTMTASVHVSRIIAKLGVSGRGEAAAVAHRLGVVDPAP